MSLFGANVPNPWRRVKRELAGSGVHIAEDSASLASQITAAAAAYAASGLQQIVLGAPGIDRAHTPVDGVLVLFMDDAPLSRFGALAETHRYQRPWVLPTAGGLIALRCDDGANDILCVDGTARPAGWPVGNWDFGGLAINAVSVSPAAYARYYGVPITLAIIGTRIANPANKLLTGAQVATLAVDYGFEIAAHSYTHGASGSELDLSIDNAYLETVAVRNLLEALVIQTGYPALLCRGYIESGNVATGDAGNTWANIRQVWNRLIRSNFDWSQSWFSSASAYDVATPATPIQHHFMALSTWTAGNLVQRIASIATPGTRAGLYFHNVEDIPGGFRNLIDRIVAERATGRLMPVTSNALQNAQVEPNAGLTIVPPLCPFGDYESMTSKPVVITTGTATDTSAIILIADTTGILVGSGVNVNRTDTGAEVVALKEVIAVDPNVSITVSANSNYTGAVTVACGLLYTTSYMFNGMRFVNLSRNAAVGVDAAGGNPDQCLHLKTAHIGASGVHGYIAVRWQYNVIPGSQYVLQFDAKLASGAQPVWTVSFLEPGATGHYGVSRHTLTLPCTALTANYETQPKTIGIPPWCTAIQLDLVVGNWVSADYLLDNMCLYKVG